ncbi:MAG: GntR family transcriptional regulator [Thermodesulfobacteriota bacterium]
MVYHFCMESKASRRKLAPRIKGPELYALIRKAITRGRFAPGQRLSERELAEQYGISRTPIREAFRYLIQEGLIIYKPNSGYRIIPLSEDLARHIMVLREALEAVAARLVMQKDPKRTAQAMKKTLPKARSAYREGKLSDLIEANQNFHQRLVEKAGNPILETMYRVLQGYIGLMMSVSLSWPRRPVETFQEHERIIIALEKRDAYEAEKAIREHIRRAGEGVLRNLRQYLTQGLKA